MKLLAHAKINRDLHILGKRPDGYHELSTIMQGLALADELEITLEHAEKEKTVSAGNTAADSIGNFTGEDDIQEGAPEATNDETGSRKNRISLSVENSDLPADETNLAWKAAEAMLREAEKRGAPTENIRVRMHLKKNTPMAAGLGGGSSDAAAVLVALDGLLNLNLGTERLMLIGKRLGADVPFCVLVNSGEGSAAHCTGIGDFIEPVPQESYPCVLVKPDLDISTPEMYKAWDEMQTVFTNDFEPIAEYRYPEIRELKKVMLSVTRLPEEKVSDGKQRETNESLIDDEPIQIQMSGSGPTFFALFQTDRAAERFYEALKEHFTTVNPTPTILLTRTLDE